MHSNYRSTIHSQSPSRRRFLSTLRTGASALAMTGACGGSGIPPKPNVVYLFSDTHRRGAMNFTQTPAVKTPHMEALMHRGVSFDHCYVNLPICTPYRAMLMTGMWPYQQGLIENHMSLNQRVDQPMGAKTNGTLGWAFKAAGYHTGYFGKWHLGGRDARPFGFDDSSVWMNTNNHRSCRYSLNGGEPVDWSGVSNAAGAMDQALAWMEEAAREPNPFFLMISLNPPHGPFGDAPEEKLALYPDASALPFHPNDEIRNFDEHRAYHAQVSVIDDEVGRMAAKLEDLGIAENTVFVYTSDHGGMSGVRGIEYGQKRNPEDESSRVPFLIQWPGTIPENVRLDCLFSTIDIFPTLCHLCNLEAHLNIQSARKSTSARDRVAADYMSAYLQKCPGRNLAPNLRGEAEALNQGSVFLMHITNMRNRGSEPQPVFRGIVTKDWLYAVQTDGEYCLYRRDGEYLYPNLVNEPGLDDIKQSLQGKLKLWIDFAETRYLDDWFKEAPEEWVNDWYAPELGNGGNRATGDRATFDLNAILSNVNAK